MPQSTSTTCASWPSAGCRRSPTTSSRAALDDEEGLARNEDAFKQYRLVPRYCVDVSVRDQSTSVFGRTYSSPVGIAPTGGAGSSGAAAT